MLKSRKILAMFAVIISISLVLLAGCKSSSKSAEDKPVHLKMGTGGTGGSFYPVGVGISRVADAHTNLKISVEATKASVENSRLLESKEIDLGMMSFPTSLKAYRGDAPFDAPIDVSVLFQLYENPVHLIVMEKSDIMELQDLKGKKISIGVPGSGNAEVSYAFFEGLLGWKEDVDYTPVYLTYTESIEAFKTGQIDAALFDTVHPTASIIELSSWNPIRLLEVSQDLLEKATGAYAPSFVVKTVPGGVYKGVDEDVQTVGHGNWLLARTDFDEDYAYELVKSIFENIDELASSHAAIQDLTPELGSRSGGIGLHKGAEKYFKEVKAIE